MRRRIINESKQWPDSWVYFEEDDLVYILLDDLGDKEMLIQMEFKKIPYPFKPPLVKCNEKDILYIYSEMFSLTPVHLQNKLIKISKKKCWCCDNLLCKNNWGPNLKISDIVEEFKTLYKIHKNVTNRQRNIEQFFGKLISKYLLIEDIPIYKFL
jgi:hypothetical protein